jgi:hypothetical protein
VNDQFQFATSVTHHYFSAIELQHASDNYGFYVAGQISGSKASRILCHFEHATHTS